jgi:uncharacterized protein YraI
MRPPLLDSSKSNVNLLMYRNFNMATQLNRPVRRLVALVSLAAALLLAGCGSLGGAESTPLPTRTPLPTFTPTPEGGQPAAAPTTAPEAAADTQPTPETAAQAPAAEAQTPTAAAQAPVTTTGTTTDTDQVVINTPAPAQTPTPEAAATAAGAQVTTNDIVNIRQGPGTNYGLAGSAQAGETFRVTGKNQTGDWWQVDYNGQTGWIFGQLVTASGTEGVAVAQNIPAAPTAAPVPPTNTPAPAAPQPTAAPVAEATQPPAAPADPNAGGNFPFILGTTERCEPNPGTTYFSGYVRDSNNNPLNGVCVHVAFYEPRKTVCSGCDGVGDGNWGHSPFGGAAPPGTPVEIFVVPCTPNMPPYGQSSDTGFGDLTPQSPKWTRVINASEQCTGITFYKK